MTTMIWYIVRRLATAALLMLLVSFIVFSLTFLAPGDPLDAIAGDYPRTPEVTAELIRKYGLDQPFIVQYGQWLMNALRLDFGTSIVTRQSVATEIGARMSVTVFLGVYAFIVAVIVGVPLGVIAALRQGSLWDRGAVGLSVIGVSAPAFATGLLLMYLFGVQWPLLPIYGAGDGFGDRLVHLTLPALTLTLTALGLIVKFTRAGMIDALRQDYIVFARARGVAPSVVILRYGLRNALVPVITSFGLVLISLLAGSVLVEQTFSLAGVGAQMVQAVLASDIPMVQGVAILIAAVVAGVSILVDLAYLAVSPDVRKGFAQ